MRITLVLSSECYPLEPQECLRLPDSQIVADFKEEVVILLGDKKQNIPNQLLCGRAVLEKALQEGRKRVDVQMCFPVEVGIKAFLGIFKRFRKRFLHKAPDVWHIPPQFLREHGIERIVRTEDNAYTVRRNLTKEEKLARYNELSESIRLNGFDDAFALSVMCHRNDCCHDALRDGHHRLNLSLRHGLKRIGITFCYASSIVACKQILLRKRLFPAESLRP